MIITATLRLFLKKFQEWFGKEHLYYRLFWGLIITFSAWNTISIFLLTLTRFFSDSISIGIDTTYLRWNNTFPAVSFCLTKNRSSSRVMEFVKRENISYKVSLTNYVKNIHDYMFTNPNNINFKEDYCDGLNSTCGVDILRVRRELLPNSCESIMSNLSFCGVLYENCSDIFKFHELEMGYCYLANNILDHESNNLPLKYGISHTDKNLKIYLKGGFLWKYEMYVHSPEDLPYFNSITYDAFSDSVVYRFNINEYNNDVDVKNEPIHKRSCKFLNERDPGSPWHYSFSTCMSYIRIQFELSECNCTHFTSPKIYESQYCNIEGLKCIEEGKQYKQNISSLQLRARKPLTSFTPCNYNIMLTNACGIRINITDFYISKNAVSAQISSKTKEYVVKNDACYPSCLEQQVVLVGSNEIIDTDIPGMIYVDIRIGNLPTVRYNRVVTQTYLDLVVSVGGVIGLFIGVSALNILEIIYLLLRKN